MSRVVRFYELGDPDVLRIEEIPDRPLNNDEVRIKVEAIGVNRADSMFRTGIYLETTELPARLGTEGAGVIQEIGTDVEGIEVGERVGTIPLFSMNVNGLYGESAVVPARAVVRTPNHISVAESAAIWTQYLTAWGALIQHGKIQAGQHVLITAASSSVGLAAIQLSKLLGAIPIAVTRQTAKKQRLVDAGADHVVSTDESSLEQAVLDITNGRGADLIFDPVAGNFLNTLAACAAQGGQIIEYGWLSLEPTPFPLFPSFQKGLSVRGYTIYEFLADSSLLSRAVEEISKKVETGQLRPIIDRVFGLEQVTEAHRHLESNNQIGKIVITV